VYEKITFKKITMLFLTIVSISSSLLFSTGIVNEHTISAHQFQINPAYHLK